MADETLERRRARILALPAEDRAVLAGLIRRQLDQIPEQMAKLREDQAALTSWLLEFAPEMLEPPANAVVPCLISAPHRAHRWVQLPGHWRECQGVTVTAPQSCSVCQMPDGSYRQTPCASHVTGITAPYPGGEAR